MYLVDILRESLEKNINPFDFIKIENDFKYIIIKYIGDEIDKKTIAINTMPNDNKFDNDISLLISYNHKNTNKNEFLIITLGSTRKFFINNIEYLGTFWALREEETPLYFKELDC